MKKILLFICLIVFILCFSFFGGQYFNFNKDFVVNESDIVSLKENLNLFFYYIFNYILYFAIKINT